MSVFRHILLSDRARTVIKGDYYLCYDTGGGNTNEDAEASPIDFDRLHNTGTDYINFDGIDYENFDKYVKLLLIKLKKQL